MSWRILTAAATLAAMLGTVSYVLATRDVRSGETTREIAELRQAMKSLATAESVDALRADMVRGFKGTKN